MKRIIISITAVAALLMVSACSVFPKPQDIPTHYYDIGLPSKQYHSNIGVQIFPFVGGVGDEVRMTFRKSSNRVEFDSYNKWANSPAKLVQCYLAFALNNNNVQVDYSMTGEILKFECNLHKKTADLAVKITLKSEKKDKDNQRRIYQEVFSSSIPVEQETASAYAAGMSQAMADITQQIIKKVENLKK